MPWLSNAAALFLVLFLALLICSPAVARDCSSSQDEASLSPIVPSVPPGDVFSQSDGFATITTLPPQILTDPAVPGYLEPTDVLLCVRSRGRGGRGGTDDGNALEVHDALKPTMCKAWELGGGPVELQLFDVWEGSCSYDVWAEYRLGQGSVEDSKGFQSPRSGHWTKSCSKVFSFTFKKTYRRMSVSAVGGAAGASHETANEGAGMTMTAYPANYLYSRGQVSITRFKYGSIMTLSSDMYVGAYVRSLGEWEDCILSLLTAFVRCGDTVWEGGSHIGTHTVPLAMLAAKVHAFEVHPRTRNLLSSNLLLNDVDEKVVVHNFGLGDKDDDGKKVYLGDGCKADVHGEECSAELKGNTGGFSIAGQAHVSERRKEEGEGGGGIKVNLKSFDSAWEEGTIDGGCPRVIKTDLEGMDLRALRGASNVIDSCTPLIYMEAYSPLRESWKGVEEYLVKKKGYSCYYDNFKTAPSDWSSHFDARDRAVFKLGRELTAQEEGQVHSTTTRSGALSFNWICGIIGHDLEVLQGLESEGRIRKVLNAEHDSLYWGPDCVEISSRLLEEGYFDVVVGGKRRSIC